MVQSFRPSWRVGAIAASVLAALIAVPAAPAVAEKGHGNQSPQVVATGLNNPRHVRWTGDALYVAEAGVGGSGPCIPSPEGGEACYGGSGSISRIKDRRQSRVVTRLPSVAGPGGANAIGPADVQVHGRYYTIALGLGAEPDLRARLPRLGQKLATVSVGRFGRPGLHVVADIAEYEDSANPDGGVPDTNPVALLGHGRRSYVVDAGGNSLLRYTPRGRVRTTAVFPSTQVPAPPFLGLPPGTLIPMDAVPTAAAYGPDGAIYVSQLTGFPFPVGGASIWRVVPGRAPTKYATGLSNVTDLAFGQDGSLYAVQIADQGLLAGPDAKGSVVRIPRGGVGKHQTLIGDLTAPYGITLHGKSAYVTTCSVCAGGGEVLRVPLR
jgi:hypothetical protein